MPKNIEDRHPDWVSIDLPTDAITLGQMRRAEPGTFHTDDLIEKNTLTGLQATAACALECILVKKSFAAAVGMPDPHPDWSREEAVELLDRAYRRLSLSEGRRATNELVRRLESAAVTQARGGTPQPGS